MTSQTEAMIGADGLSILFGQDWPYFDQRKWPITAGSAFGECITVIEAGVEL
jgi:hypothetical protein